MVAVEKPRPVRLGLFNRIARHGLGFGNNK